MCNVHVQCTCVHPLPSPSPPFSPPSLPPSLPPPPLLLPPSLLPPSLPAGGNLVRREVAHNLMRLIAEGTDDEEADMELRQDAVSAYIELLDKPHLPDILIKIICWVGTLHLSHHHTHTIPSTPHIPTSHHHLHPSHPHITPPPHHPSHPHITPPPHHPSHPHITPSPPPLTSPHHTTTSTPHIPTLHHHTITPSPLTPHPSPSPFPTGRW